MSPHSPSAAPADDLIDLADRDDAAEIEAQREFLAASDFARRLLANLTEATAVLNEKRQLLAANPAFHRLIEGIDGEVVPGQRPGEILHCLHAYEAPGGCGNAAACRACGALRAILAAVDGHGCRGDCEVTRELPLGDLRLTVRTRPLEIRFRRYLIISFL